MNTAERIAAFVCAGLGMASAPFVPWAHRGVVPGSLLVPYDRAMAIENDPTFGGDHDKYIEAGNPIEVLFNAFLVDAHKAITDRTYQQEPAKYIRTNDDGQVMAIRVVEPHHAAAVGEQIAARGG